MKNFLKIFGIALVAIALSFAPAKKKVIVIDVGHGGKDAGFELNEILEKEITLDIANKIKQLSSSSKVEVVLTRNEDHYISLADRVESINALNPDYMISLHVNASENELASGFELYVGKNNIHPEKSVEFAEDIKKQLSPQMPVREIKTANFRILNEAKCPGTLIELGFLTNEDDLQYVLSENGQNQIARSISNALK